MIGAGIAAALLIIAVVLLVVLTRSNGDPEWQLAEKAYLASSDPASLQDATFKLITFLERFPDQSHAGLAAEYRDLARLRQAFAAKTDWSQPLAVAQQVLPEMLNEADFPKVREAVAKMLPEMAIGLAKQAKDGAKGPLPQRQRQAQMALAGLALAEDWRFVPDSLRPWAQLQTTGEEVAVLARSAARDAELEQASAAIRAAIASGSIADAMARRDRLCDLFPELRIESTVESLDDEIMLAEAKGVKVVTQSRAAETKPRSSPIASTSLLVARGNSSGGSAASGSKQNPVGSSVAQNSASDIPAPIVQTDSLVCVQFAGTAYWLSKADGAPIARRFIGFDSPLPAPVAGATDNAFIVFDGPHQELYRFAPADGSTTWRQALGESLTGQLATNGRLIWAATRSGKLIEVDVNSGANPRSAQIPEQLASGPTIGVDAAALSLHGQRGTQFTIRTNDFSVTAVKSPEVEPAKRATPPRGSVEAIVTHIGAEPVLRVAMPDATGATPKWQIFIGGPILGEPIVGSDGSVQCLDRIIGAAKIVPKAVPLQVELAPAAAAPIWRQARFVAPWDKDNWLVVTDTNQATIVSIATGEPAAVPFQPQLAAGATSAWTMPAVIADKQEAVVTDGKKRIYRIGLKTEPIRHLAAIAEAPLSVPLVSPVAVVDAYALAVDEGRNLLAFNIADLKIAKSWPLETALAWGPVQAGGAILLATDRELICIDNRPEIAWRKPLAVTPVGAASAIGANFVVATPGGTILQFDRKTGEDREKLDVGEPLAGGVLEVGKRWLVAGHDGSLHWIERK